MRSFSISKGVSLITHQGEAWLDRLAVLVFLAGLMVLPLAVSPWGFDGRQLPKQAVLFLFTGALGLLWVVRCTMRRTVVFPWDLPTKMATLLLGGLFVSSLFSIDPVTSFLGMGSQIGQAWLTWLCLFLVFCLGRVFFSTKRRMGLLIGGLLGSGFLVSVVSLMSWLGVLGSGTFFARQGFNPIGSPFDLVTYLVPLCVLALGCAVLDMPTVFFAGPMPRRAMWGVIGISSILFLELFVIVDLALIWAALLITGLVWLGVFAKMQEGRTKKGLVLVGLMTLCALFMGARHLSPSLAHALPNPSQSLRDAFHIQLASEVIPSNNTSWQVTKQLSRENPLFGSGQGTWSYGYDRFHDVALNQSPFWKTRFPHASSFFFTFLGTTGWVNLLLVVLFFWTLHLGVRRTCFASQTRSELKQRTVYLLCIPLFTAFGLSFFRFLEVSGIFFIASLATFLAILLPLDENGTPITPDRRPFFSSMFGAFAIGCIAFMLISLPRMAADAQYARAVERLDQSARARSLLESAQRWNPLQDTYLHILSQLSLQAGERMMQTETSSTQGTLAVDEFHRALQLSQQAIQLNPANADHWLDGASAYQRLSRYDSLFDEGSLLYLTEAEKRQPLNPQISYQIAQIYLVRGDREQKWIDGKDERTKQEATQRQQDAFTEARHWLEQSLSLKADFVPSRYDLAALEERQGRRTQAIQALEMVWKNDKLNTRVMGELGLLYAQDRQWEASARSFEAFLEQEPNNASVHWYLALVYEQLHRIDDALVQLHLVLNQAPNDEQAQEQLRVLQRAKANSLIPPVPTFVSSTTPTATTTSATIPSPKKKKR